MRLDLDAFLKVWVANSCKIRGCIYFLNCFLILDRILKQGVLNNVSNMICWCFAHELAQLNFTLLNCIQTLNPFGSILLFRCMPMLVVWRGVSVLVVPRPTSGPSVIGPSCSAHSWVFIWPVLVSLWSYWSQFCLFRLLLPCFSEQSIQCSRKLGYLSKC